MKMLLLKEILILFWILDFGTVHFFFYKTTIVLI